MTVYVDETFNYGVKGDWCHMATDGDIQELHAMADKIGLKREWFQIHPRLHHYDLRPSKRKLAVKNGAIEVSRVELYKKCILHVPNEDCS